MHRLHGRRVGAIAAGGGTWPGLRGGDAPPAAQRCHSSLAARVHSLSQYSTIIQNAVQRRASRSWTLLQHATRGRLACDLLRSFCARATPYPCRRSTRAFASTLRVLRRMDRPVADRWRRAAGKVQLLSGKGFRKVPEFGETVSPTPHISALPRIGFFYYMIPGLRNSRGPSIRSFDQQCTHLRACPRPGM